MYYRSGGSGGGFFSPYAPSLTCLTYASFADAFQFSSLRVCSASKSVSVRALALPCACQQGKKGEREWG
ncbi:MAG: hypothetical protein QW578_07940 [Thermoplasmatales archaeon]